MRFTLIKNLRQDKSMHPILTGLLFFTFFYIISDILVKHLNFGVFPNEVMTTLFGNEDEFIDPLSASSFLEFWHVEIFFMMMILLTLSTVFIRLAKHTTFKAIVLNALMLSALFSLISLLLAFFISQAFVLVYSILFFAWHIIAMYMIFYSLWKLYYDPNI
ncbi:MAG: hypothetical protein ACI9TV_001688 [Sulfurimonas sp.]|jgi:hypothetical protein|uniref:hypothetical protein n=1 Tax=Sulfurimonas sp. TaxID=2022749 RepID=UPI0039E6D6A4